MYIGIRIHIQSERDRERESMRKIGYVAVRVLGGLGVGDGILLL